MRAVDIIMKKRDGEALGEDEIIFMVDGFTKGYVTDYQMSAFTMAIFFKGMTDLEATYLTKAMLNSGDTLDLSGIKGIKCDKHSTGGVGDKTSLSVAPIVASLGIKFAKMSGRGLGHTGGTLDKLESIPGYNINLTTDEFIKQVNDIGLAIIGQTATLAPADKKLYSLRDVTATVDSIPLIASSIMSKKLAAGSDVIVLDVKVGSGAFMKNEHDAEKLAKLMVEIGKMCNKDMTAVLTNMDEPLGCAVGNSLEVIEAINTLKGEGPSDFTALVLEIASHIVLGSKICDTLEEAKALCVRQIENGEALKTLHSLIEAQGGDGRYVYDTSLFTKAKYVYEIKALESGYVSRINALMIGNAAMKLGAGRAVMSDVIDHSVGIVLNKKVADYTNVGETIAYVHSNKEDISEVMGMIYEAYGITNDKIDSKLILNVIK